MRNHQNNVFCFILVFVMGMAFLSSNAMAEDTFAPHYEEQKTSKLSFKLVQDKWIQDEKPGNPLYRPSARRVQILTGDKIKYGVEGGLGADNETQLLLRLRKEF